MKPKTQEAAYPGPVSLEELELSREIGYGALSEFIDGMDRTAQNLRPRSSEDEFSEAASSADAYESIDALFFVRPYVALEIARSEATYRKIDLSDEAAISLMLNVFLIRSEIKED